MATGRKNDPAGRQARQAKQRLRGQEAQNVARAGAKRCGAPYNQASFVTKKAGMDYLLMSGAAGTLGLTWPEIEAGAEEIRKKAGKKGGKKGGTSAQTKARFAAAGRGAPRNAKTGQASNTAGLDYLLMGGARGTRSLTWRQSEDGEQKLKVKGGESTQVVARIGAVFCGAPLNAAGQASDTVGLDYLLMGGARGTRSLTWRQKLKMKGGEASQGVARASAAFVGAPVDAETGQASARAGVLYALAGGMEGCAGKSWTQIEAKGDKRRKEGLKAGTTTAVGNHRQAALAEHHSHICKSSRCDKRCTPSMDANGKLRIVHTCTDPFKSANRPAGLANHICRKCHQSGIVCRTKVCSYCPCATPRNVCSHLHT